MKTSAKILLSFVTVFIMTLAVRATPQIGLPALSKGVAAARTSSVFSFFRANKQRNVVNMTWTTPNPGDVSFFVVQKSADGENFDNLGEIFCDGVTPMQTFQDTELQSGDNYYRVVAILYDGNIEFSDVQKIRHGRSRGHHGCPH